MRCGNIRIHVEIPVYADKNHCFCDDNHVSYSIPAIRKACETASNLPIIQYDEQGTEKVVGVAQSIKWNPHGFIEVDGQLLFGGTNETVELGKDDCVVSMELSTVGKRGSCCIKTRVTEAVSVLNGDATVEVSRSRWVVDREPPVFTQDREYVERRL